MAERAFRLAAELVGEVAPETLMAEGLRLTELVREKNTGIRSLPLGDG